MSLSGASQVVQGLRLHTCMAGVPSLVGELTFHVPHSVVMPTKKPPALSAVLLGPTQLAFPPQGGGCGMLSRGALASECGPRDWGPSPKSRWGGWPATNPLRVLRDDLCLGQRNQKLERQGWGGKLLFCYPQADSRWDSSENLELT